MVPAVTASADIEVYPFQARPGLPYLGMPDADATSGRFVTVANGLRSLGDSPALNGEVNINLQVPGKNPSTGLPLADFALSIFDGDLQIWTTVTPSGSSYACSGIRTWDTAQPVCWPLDDMEFQLYRDPLVQSNTHPGDLLYAWDSSQMPDNAWCALNPALVPACLPGALLPQDPGALDARAAAINTGDYFYHLVARWKTRNFPVNPVTGAGGEANNFKVAVEGYPYLRAGSTVGFIGYGPVDVSNRPGDPLNGIFPPTTYDGTFTFGLLNDTPTSQLDLWDGDVDVYVPLCANVGGVYQNPGSCAYPQNPSWNPDPLLSDTDDFNSPYLPPFPTGIFTLAQGANPGNGPSDGFPLGPFQPDYSNVIGGPPTYSVTSPSGEWTVDNDNTSGDQEWELFRVGLNAAPVPPNPLDQADVTVDTLPPGLYDWRFADIDGRNLVFLHADYNVSFSPQDCGLELTKSCEIAALPVEAFDCAAAKPLDALTMIWRGTDTVWVKAWKGAVGTTTLLGQQKAVPGQEITFDGYLGAPNDVFWEIFAYDPSGGGGAGTKLGTSTFHISCSDIDMNDASDCGKSEGDGKNNSTAYVNTWQLEGLAGDNGVTLDCNSADQGQARKFCKTERGPNPTCATSGKPRSLTFQYTGGTCQSSNNPQNGKFVCGGTINGSLAATLKSMDGYSVTPASVQPGQEFTVTSSADMKADSAFELTTNGNKQTLKIHTSCSQTLAGGNVFGGLTLKAINGERRDPKVTYRYALKNTGTSTLEGLTLIDDRLGPIGSMALFASGAEKVYEREATLEQLGPQTNKATATATLRSPSGSATSCVALDAAIVDVGDVPPPVCEITGAPTLKIKDKIVEWELRDTGGDAVTIDSIAIDWPSAMKKLKRVKLGKKMIFEGDRAPTQTVLGDGDWKGKAKDRTLKAGKRAKLKLEFEDGDTSVTQAGFKITVNFTSGCSVTFTPGGGGGGGFECQRPVDALTMIWDGAEPVNVIAWKGAKGSTLLGAFNGVTKGNPVTVTGYTGAPNDVIWEVFRASDNQSLGLSTFHISCSDRTMNSSDDCGSRQGNGKNDTAGYINDWLFEGMVSQGGALDCTP
jgi:hypothetical protein